MTDTPLKSEVLDTMCRRCLLTMNGVRLIVQSVVKRRYAILFIMSNYLLVSKRVQTNKHALQVELVYILWHPGCL